MHFCPPKKSTFPKYIPRFPGSSFQKFISKLSSKTQNLIFPFSFLRLGKTMKNPKFPKKRFQPHPKLIQIQSTRSSFPPLSESPRKTSLKTPQRLERIWPDSRAVKLLSLPKVPLGFHPVDYENFAFEKKTLVDSFALYHFEQVRF